MIYKAKRNLSKYIILIFTSIIFLNSCSNSKLIRFHNKDRNKLGFMNTKGDIVIEPKYSELSELSEGYAFFKENKYDKWGVINSKSDIICKDKFHEIISESVFSEGLVAVKINNKWGFADTNCNIVIEPKFTKVSNFSEGLAVATEGEEILSTPFPMVQIKTVKNKYGFIDKTGKYAIKPEYNYARSFKDGLAVIGYGEYIDTIWICPFGGKEGFIDRQGNIIINPQYKSVEDFSEGLAGFYDKDKKKGYINKKGDVVISPQFYDAGKFHEGLALVRPEGGSPWGYIDKKGEIIIKPQFDTVSDFSEGYAAVGFESDKQKFIYKKGFIDKTGNFVISPKFKFASNFEHGLASVSSEGGADSFIDKKGNFIEPKY